MFSSVLATIPPLIARLEYAPPNDVIMASERALLAITHADRDAQNHPSSLGRFMMRTESAASSKIERVTASSRDYARALTGNRSNTSALSMVAATTALQALVTRVGERSRFELDDILIAHRALMNDDAAESRYAGRLRDMQNWIGGSDHSPRDALHIPPAPERVAELLDDLITYLNRDDVPAITQAAIGHAQFESIHPFTDGNGRIGRALIAASLRRRGVSRNAIVPLASGLLAKREDYFTALGAYRQGDPAPLTALFARSAYAAATCSRATVVRLIALPSEWRSELRPRAGSAMDSLISGFAENPVMGADNVIACTGGAESQAYRAVDRLVDAGIVEEITGRKRDRAWAAGEVLAELDDLDRRIQAAMG